MRPATESSPAPARLKATILKPLAFAVMVLGLVVAVALGAWQADARQRRHRDARLRLQVSFEQAVVEHADGLSAALHVVDMLPDLKRAFRTGDREGLLASVRELNKTLELGNNVTHFYFMALDRTCFLRVHHPARHGDRINRVTAVNAEQTGRAVNGIELGPLGTLTLRVVLPWTAEGRRIGYLELGTETEHMLAPLAERMGIQAIVLVRKALLDRPGWEAGMKMLGRHESWDTWRDWVQSAWVVQARGQRRWRLPADFDPGAPEGASFEEEGRHIQPQRFPITDAAGRHVADVVALSDVTEEVLSAQRALMAAVGAAALVVVVLFGIFWQSLGRFERQLMRLQRTEQHLNALARSDPLTGAENRRQFDISAADQERLARWHHRPLGALMVDLDDFKSVNDNYGHAVGDDFLRAAATSLRACLRPTDHLARYGGEEFAVLLPETNLAATAQVAERLRQAVLNLKVPDGRGSTVQTTVSIGATVFDPRLNDPTLEGALLRADEALYSAKRSGKNCIVVVDTPGTPATAESDPPAV